MKKRKSTAAGIPAFILLAALSGCGQPDQPEPVQPQQETTAAGTARAGALPTGEEIVPGLTMRILKAGGGRSAAPGDTAVVHYTGWLYDGNAPDYRGKKFDSSVDRGQHFSFPLGGGRVIRGWDQGVVGMQVGEVRELTIAPAMGYGERGAGNVIPPGATLVFEVELAGIEGLEGGKEGQ